MTTTISVPADLAGAVSAFFESRQLPVRVVQESGGDVQVQAAEERRRCDRNTLWRGGWITCQDAWALAGRLDIPREQAGALLDLVEVKVKDCQLGCF